VITDGPREGRDIRSRNRIHAARELRRTCHARTPRNSRASARNDARAALLTGRCAQKRRAPARRGPERGGAAAAQDFVAGLTPGLSLKNCLLSSMKFFH
jgi:hypothetical protein